MARQAQEFGPGHQRETSDGSPPPDMQQPVDLGRDEVPAEETAVEEHDDDCEESRMRQRPPFAPTLFHQARSDGDTMNSTRSLYDNDIVYHELYGRRYAEDYFMPNDEDEQDRLQMLHTIFTLIIPSLTSVPLSHPTRVLDVGTGTGEWAMAMADLYPSAEITGTDIAKIQSTVAPLNVFFEVDDAEQEGGWTFAEDLFDLVHFRDMAGAFQDWTYVYREAFRHIKPGGWIEVIDFAGFDEFMAYFSNDEIIMGWYRAWMEATAQSGRQREPTHLEPRMLAEAGFTDVAVSTRKIPFGTWPGKRQDRNLGSLFLVTQLLSIEAECMRPLTEQLGWTPDQVRKVCAEVVSRMKALGTDASKSKGLSTELKVLIGRKPGGDERCVPGETCTAGGSL